MITEIRREQNRIAQARWRSKHREEKSRQNALYYLDHKEEKKRRDPRFYALIKSEERKRKYRGFDFHRYIEDQEYDENWKHLLIQYQLVKYGKIDDSWFQ